MSLEPWQAIKRLELVRDLIGQGKLAEAERQIKDVRKGFGRSLIGLSSFEDKIQFLADLTTTLRYCERAGSEFDRRLRGIDKLNAVNRLAAAIGALDPDGRFRRVAS